MLENSPHPDYQWFYDPTWSYTTAQITANEEAIFDHMFHNVGRGVIFNEMWHDYSISSAPVHEGKDKRITNENNFPFYEAMKTKFGTLPIYCPEPQELAQKLRAMAQWNYSWKGIGRHDRDDDRPLESAPERYRGIAGWHGSPR